MITVRVAIAFLLVAPLCSIFARDEKNVVESISVKMVRTQPWHPSLTDLRAGITASRQRIGSLSKSGEDTSLSKITLSAISRNWERYACFAEAALLEDRKMIEFHFILATPAAEDPDLVIGLGNLGAVQWKSVYDVEKATIRSVESNQLMRVDLTPGVGGQEEKFTFESSDESVGSMIKTVADLFGLDASIPEELFRIKKDIRVENRSSSEIFDSLVDGTGFQRKTDGRLISFPKAQIEKKPNQSPQPTAPSRRG